MGEEHIESFQKDLSFIVHQISVERKRRNEVSRDIKGKEKELEDIRSLYRIFSSRVEELKNKILEKEREISVLEGRMRTLQKEFESEKDSQQIILSEFSSRCSFLKKEKENFEKEVSSLSKSSEELSESLKKARKSLNDCAVKWDVLEKQKEKEFEILSLKLKTLQRHIEFLEIFKKELSVREEKVGERERQVFKDEKEIKIVKELVSDMYRSMKEKYKKNGLRK